MSSALVVDFVVTVTPAGDRRAGVSETPTTTRPARLGWATVVSDVAVCISGVTPNHVSCINVLKHAKPPCVGQVRIGQIRAL